jgi:hypothetical protein
VGFRRHNDRFLPVQRQRRPAERPEFRDGDPRNLNFLDCVKSRAKCNCDILDGHLSTSATVIGNIAHRTRSFLEWDAKTEKFTDNASANQWLHYRCRSPYKLG